MPPFQMVLLSSIGNLQSKPPIYTHSLTLPSFVLEILIELLRQRVCRESCVEQWSSPAIVWSESRQYARESRRVQPLYGNSQTQLHLHRKTPSPDQRQHPPPVRITTPHGSFFTSFDLSASRFFSSTALTPLYQVPNFNCGPSNRPSLFPPNTPASTTTNDETLQNSHQHANSGFEHLLGRELTSFDTLFPLVMSQL